MAGPTEFSLESVRQFMLGNDGQVTNHALVKHFKAWLTHPTEKESARQKFKEYVNTLATIKSENGEKFLVLKRRFYPSFSHNARPSESSSFLDEIMSDFANSSSHTETVSISHRHLPPTPVQTYHTPPQPDIANGDLKILGFSTEQGTQPLSSTFRSPPPYRPPPIGNSEIAPPLPVRKTMGIETVGQSFNKKSSSDHTAMNVEKMGQIVTRKTSIAKKEPNVEAMGQSTNEKAFSEYKSISVKEIDQSNVMENDDHKADVNIIKQTSGASNSEHYQLDESISVRERTKTYNRMSSEMELNHVGLKPSESAPVSVSSSVIKRRNSRATNSDYYHPLRRGSSVSSRPDDADTVSISTLDGIAKQWMIRAALADYHTMAKMLSEDASLAKRKDFTSGYTALHWAAKHGSLDCVKLLAGQYKANSNAKSHGGYTPLHLSCQFNNHDVFDLLVTTYGADISIRDNAGKKPRQYLVGSVHDSALGGGGPTVPGGFSLSSDTFKLLKERRKHRRQAAEKIGSGGILRFGSLSVKVKKTTDAFNNYFSAMEKKSSWLPGLDRDALKMPAPKAVRKMRKHIGGRGLTVAPFQVTRKVEEQESDSEFGFDSRWASDVTSVS